jgi:hypothetical protein
MTHAEAETRVRFGGGFRLMTRMAGETHLDEAGFRGGRGRGRLQLGMQQIAKVTVVQDDPELTARDIGQVLEDPHFGREADD